jgi:hypothetical protein
MSVYAESSADCSVTSSGASSDGYGGMWHDDGTVPPPECLDLTSRSARALTSHITEPPITEPFGSKIQPTVILFFGPGSISAAFSMSSSHEPMRIVGPKGNCWAIFSGLLGSLNLPIFGSMVFFPFEHLLFCILEPYLK